ncbi:MAG: CYTH domain-containing protein [candidate division Zixibacteria bacterium]|nr:CYTH domain-containing protein [candidate division Zixibacteria bacterium]
MKPADSVEIEIKLRLDSFMDYLKLVGLLCPLDDEIHHTNGFFDTEDRRLAKGGWALRARAESHRGLLTIKSIPTEEGMAVVRREIESEIPRSLALDILSLRHEIMAVDVPPIQFLRKEFPKVSPAKLIQFDNVRQFKKYPIGDREYLLEIDKTSFSDGSVDYELEVEFEDMEQREKIETGLQRLLVSLGIPFERQPESKFHRALKKARLL